MKKLGLLLVCMLAAVSLSDTAHVKMLFDSPAEVWVETLLPGNGRICAVVYGNLESEEYQLNVDAGNDTESRK